MISAALLQVVPCSCCLPKLLSPPLRLQGWKSGSHSVFCTENSSYQAKPAVHTNQPGLSASVLPPAPHLGDQTARVFLVSQQEPTKQADFVRSKSFLITPAKPNMGGRQGTKLNLKEGLQRGISLSHQNLGMTPVSILQRLEVTLLCRSCSCGLALWNSCTGNFLTQLLQS